MDHKPYIFFLYLVNFGFEKDWAIEQVAKEYNLSIGDAIEQTKAPHTRG